LKLNVSSYCQPVTTLGPGKRFALWVQGCPFTCSGCISPDYIPFKDANWLLVYSLADHMAVIDAIDGLDLRWRSICEVLFPIFHLSNTFVPERIIIR
jgi:anaerobic ribonucleoside-triphosphate reductase activating protein